MPLTRIMMIFMDLTDAAEAADMAVRAVQSAGSPNGLRFALPKRLEQRFEAVCQARPALDKSRVAFYGDRGRLSSAAALIKDESHFLALTGPYDFQDKWDQTLLNRLSKTPEKNAVLTGSIGEMGGSVPVQAYLPALGERFEESGVSIIRGLPLICSAAPVPTLVIDPSLIFGRTAFLQLKSLRLETLSMTAYIEKIPVYALDRAALWPLRPLPERRLARPADDSVPQATLTRFEQLIGFHYEDRRSGVRTQWGLFTIKNAYPQRLPNRLAVSQRAKALFARSKSGGVPLMVTAFIDLPEPRKPLPVYLMRFEYLRALENLPLYLYTGGSQERLLRAIFPNAHSYPDNALLSRSLLQSGMTMKQWMQRNKLLLLNKTVRQHPDFTHVVWVNADMVKHPICPQAVPDFSSMMDDRVHLATVNGVPDASFLLVPVKCLPALVDGLTAITQMDEAMGRDFSEAALYERLYQRRADLFTLHPMPEKHLLFFKAFDPALLDAHLQTLLNGKIPLIGRIPARKRSVSHEQAQ